MFADTFIKQQLSSLLFVKSICETRIQRLNDGLEDTDFILPGVSVMCSILLNSVNWLQVLLTYLKLL